MKIVQKMIGLFLFCTVSIANSQDPHFSQFYANPLYLNPAFAGTSVCPRLVMNYRNQWPAIPGTYVTYNASYDQYVENMSGGVGLMLTSDNAGEGTLKTNTISGMYSYSAQVSRKFSVKAAFQATVRQISLDWDKLTFGDQIDERFGFIKETHEERPDNLVKTYPDFSAGILGYGENFYSGVAVHHMTEPNEGFISVSQLPMRFTAHLGWVMNLEHHKRRKLEDPVISPNLLFMKQRDFEEMNYGLYFNRYPFVGGLWFRQGFDNADAFVVLVGIQTSVVKIGYCYDVTVSKLTNASGGSHEISFAMQFNCRQKPVRYRKIVCPVF